MSKKAIVSALFLASSILTFGQFTVKYLSAPDQEKADSFYFPLVQVFNATSPFGRMDTYLLKNISFSRLDTSNTTVTYMAKDTMICLFGDLLGHESFVIPGDTVTIRFKKMEKIEKAYRLDSFHLSTFAHQFYYEGKNKYIYSLFDSIAYNTGSVYFSFADFGISGNNLPDLLKQMSENYHSKLSYTSGYCMRNRIPSNISRLAIDEIRSSYILNLMHPLEFGWHGVTYKDYPVEFLDTLRNASFADPSSFFRTCQYSSAALNRIYFFQDELFKNLKGSEAKFNRTYTFIDRQPVDKSITEYLLAGHLIIGINNDYPCFDSLFSSFQIEFPASPYARPIDSLYKTHKESPPILWSDAVSANVSDTAGRRQSLKAVLRNKPALIDCWASWCVPCLNEMPFSDAFEKEYGNKVDFIYLSFDRKQEDWLKKTISLSKTRNSFLLDKNFRSTFAEYFKLYSIPRYILIDKNGNILDDNTPRPSSKAEFTALLNKALK